MVGADRAGVRKEARYAAEELGETEKYAAGPKGVSTTMVTKYHKQLVGEIVVYNQ